MQEYELMEFTHTITIDSLPPTSQPSVRLSINPYPPPLPPRTSLLTSPRSSPIPPPPRPFPLLSGHLQRTRYVRQPMRLRPRPVLHLRGVHGLVQLQLQAREVKWVERFGNSRNTVGYNPLPCPPLLYLINLARSRMPWCW